MLRSLFLLTMLPLLGHAPAATAGRATAASPSLAHPTDTIVVRLPNQAVLTVTVRDAAQLRQLKNYHLDSLTTRLAGYIKQAEAAGPGRYFQQSDHGILSRQRPAGAKPARANPHHDQQKAQRQSGRCDAEQEDSE